MPLQTGLLPTISTGCSAAKERGSCSLCAQPLDLELSSSMSASESVTPFSSYLFLRAFDTKEHHKHLKKRHLHSDRTGLSWPHTWVEYTGRREELPISSLEHGHAVKGQCKVWEQGTCPSPSASSHSHPGFVLSTFSEVCMLLPSLKLTLPWHTAQCFLSHTN